jgi:rubrerythrin
LAAQTKDMQKQHEDLAEEERARARSLQKMEMERKEEEVSGCIVVRSLFNHCFSESQGGIGS